MEKWTISMPFFYFLDKMEKMLCGPLLIVCFYVLDRRSF